VQFGGQYARFSPKPSTLQIAENILNTYTVTPIYARIDGIETASQFYLMEVELIEPDLYFNIVPEAKGRFVDCVLERYSTRI
jgi:hypothetical protein